MTPVDYGIVLVCAVSAGIGVWRGLVTEALSLLTLLAAIWLAWRFGPLVAPALGGWVGDPDLRLWVGRIAVFVAALVAGALVSWLARTLVRHTGLTGVDRLLGAGFGLLRGIVIVGLGVLALQYLGMDQDAWWQSARLRTHAERAAAAVRYYAELGNRYLQSQGAGLNDALGDAKLLY